MLIFKTRFQVKMNVGLTFTATPTLMPKTKPNIKIFIKNYGTTTAKFIRVCKFRE